MTSLHRIFGVILVSVSGVTVARSAERYLRFALGGDGAQPGGLGQTWRKPQNGGKTVWALVATGSEPCW